MELWVKGSATVEREGRPYVTMEEARRMVREALRAASKPASITVHVGAGRYRPESFVFTEEDCAPDCPVIYEADGDVILHGGVTIPKQDWRKPEETVAARFDESIRDQVYMVDLTEYGLSKSDWGEMQTIGAFCTVHKYDDVPGGSRCELFCGDRRMTVARYPNEGFNSMDAIADVGDCAEFPAQNYYADWHNRRNHRGGTYIIDRKTNERIKKWADPSTAWMFGYFMWDWADSSTPITVDTVNRRVFPKYVSQYGAVKGCHYYLYNVLEELDTPGEWYLAREEGKLYFIPAGDGETIDFYCDSKPLIDCRNTSHMTFRGFTLQCTMGDACTCLGDHMVFERLLVKNIGGTALVCTGRCNLADSLEITHTGKGGVTMIGGDRITLTPGENRVTNCYIHDFSQVYQTYQPGVRLDGVGNRCDHCEICDSPHSAILYGGNEQIIEYNYIHHVVLHSSDAGAIYAGYHWTAHGCVIRYNRLEHIGAGEFRPDGIYWDDGHSGQTAYGNVLIDVRKNGFLVGGGRENVVERNLIIDCGTPMEYDERNRAGFLRDGWARAAVNNPEAGHWANLRQVPYNEGIWKEKYPLLSNMITRFDDPDNPDFPINPAYSVVRDNVIIDGEGRLGNLAESVYTYSTVENNRVYRSAEEAGLDRESLRFETASPVWDAIAAWSDLPVDQMGRRRSLAEI